MSDLADLTAYVTGKNMLLGASTFAVITALRMSFKEFFRERTGQRILPLLPFLIALIGASLGLSEAAPTWQDKVFTGIIVGAMVSAAFKAGKTSIMGIGLPPKKPKKSAKAKSKKVPKS